MLLGIQPVVPWRVPPRMGVVPDHEPPHLLPLLFPLLGILPSPMEEPAGCRTFSFTEEQEFFRLSASTLHYSSSSDQRMIFSEIVVEKVETNRSDGNGSMALY
ncbi:hypothetical protein ABZP36_024217 [Zizania latifolia]